MSALLDAAVFPGIQGGPLEHSIAAKAIAFYEAMTYNFTCYAKQVQKKNAQAMAQAFLDAGYHILSGGTDNHLLLLDLSKQNITGKEAEAALEKADIITNRNLVPFDKNTPSHIRYSFGNSCCYHQRLKRKGYTTDSGVDRLPA
ncbi:MAG: hypothetical protein NQ127_04250 [Candidatus Cardinium sp.]|nr:hypothetical protein [Candidatus Cardinium sp.]